MPYKNPKDAKAQSLRYYKKHRERLLAYRLTRREKDREIWRRWAKKNPERRMEHLRKYKAKNPDYVKDYARRAYVRIAFKNFPNKCNCCSSIERLQVHHKDRNRRNNELVNLEIFCGACHVKEHS